MGIKLLTMLLLEGFSNATEGLIFGNICSLDHRIQAYAERIQYMFNNDTSRIIKWKYYIPNYHDAIEILRQKKEFTDEEIKHYQHLIDTWFQVWIELHGLSGCTNYTHML